MTLINSHLIFLLTLLLLLTQRSEVSAQILDSDYSPALEDARDLLSAGKWKKGERLLNELRRQSPTSAPILATSGRLELAFGRMKTAEKYLSKAVALAPTNPIALIGMAEVLEAKQDYEGAMIYAERAFFYNNELHLYEPIITLKTQLHLRQEDLGEAEQLMAATLNSDLSRSRFMNELAFIYCRQRQPLKALDVLLECSKRYPKDLQTLTNLGHVFNTIGHHHEAEVYLLKAKKISKTDPLVLSNLAITRFLTGEWREAAELMQASLELDAGLKSTARLLDIAIAAQGGQCEAACAMYMRELAEPTSVGAHDYLIDRILADCGCE